MLLKSLIVQLLFNYLIFWTVMCDRPIVSFNVFERDNTLNTLGQYFASLVIPSLHIRAETNLTLNKSNDLSEDYSVEFKSEEPFNLEAVGSVRTWIDLETMARVFDVSLNSKTLSHLTGQSRTLIVKTLDQRTVFLTTAALDDSLNKLSAKYNSTLILGQTCPEITLSHNLTTIPDQSLLYFSSNVSEICDLDKESSQMAINISLSSTVWQLANAELKQIFNFGKNGGSESMNASHPLMDISVVSDWNANNKLMLFKKAFFESKIKHLIPDFEIEYKKFKKLPNQLLINILKEVPKFFDNLNSKEEL